MSKRWGIWLSFNIVTLIAFPLWFMADTAAYEATAIAEGRLRHDSTRELVLIGAFILIGWVLLGLNVLVTLGHWMKVFVNRKR